MKSNWLLVVAAAGALGLVSPVLAQKGSAATTGSKFAVDINYGKHGKGGTAQYWVKGDSVREEKKSGGGLRVVLISNDDGVYIKNKTSNIWARMPKAVAYRLVDRLLGGPSGDPKPFLKEHKAVKTGVQKWNGEPCQVWSYKSAKDIEKYRLWLSAKTGKPVRLERDALLGRFREKVTIIYTNFAWNVPLDETLFKIPANEQVRDFKNPVQNAKK